MDKKSVNDPAASAPSSFGADWSEWQKNDPEFAAIFENFAFHEAAEYGNLDKKTRQLCLLATILGCQDPEALRAFLPAALDDGLTPVEVKETLYQAAAYLGMGRIYPVFRLVNELLLSRGESLPIPPQGTVSPSTRLERGEQAQVDIFGAQMRGFSRTGREDRGKINEWLSANCFGDYYTRGGLTYRQREVLTFCFLSALGGCEPQLTSHAAANLRLGNDRQFLISVVSLCLPYVGYPRSLNAIACINAAVNQSNQSTQSDKKE